MAHELVGVRAKIQRAEEHIGSLNREITSFLAQKPPPYEVVGEHQDDGLKYSYVVRKVPKVPSRFAIITGDAIHNLRSGLDHLVYALVIKNGGTPTSQTQFPICTTVEKFEAAVSRGRIQGVSTAAENLIRQVQPYHSPTPDDTYLAALDELSVLDKHRAPVMVAAAVHLGHKIVFNDQPGFIGKKIDTTITSLPDHRSQPWTITKEGEVLFSFAFEKPAPHVKVDVEFTVHISFEKVGRAKREPVVNILSKLLDAAKAGVRLFEPEFN